MVDKKVSLHHNKLNSEGEGGGGGSRGGGSIILIRQMFCFTGRWTYNCCGFNSFSFRFCF